MQVVLSVFSVRLFCFIQPKTVCRYGCMYFLAAQVMHLFIYEPVLWVVICLQCKCKIVLVKGRHIVESQFYIDVVRMCVFYMLCRLCIP